MYGDMKGPSVVYCKLMFNFLFFLLVSTVTNVSVVYLTLLWSLHRCNTNYQIIFLTPLAFKRPGYFCFDLITAQWLLRDKTWHVK